MKVSLPFQHGSYRKRVPRSHEKCQGHKTQAGTCCWNTAAQAVLSFVRLCLPCWTTMSKFSGGGKPTRNSYSSSTSRSNMHLSPVGWPGPAGPAGPVQFPPLLTPAAPTSASFASPSALIPWAIDKGEALSLAFQMSGIDRTEILSCGKKISWRAMHLYDTTSASTKQIVKTAQGVL